MTEKELEKLIGEAIACHQNQEYERELELWYKIGEIEPDNPRWKHNFALALMNNNRLVEALELFNILAEEHPDLSRVHNNRAVLLMRMGFELQYLTPVFIQALATSDNIPDFARHFMNLCGAIAYGLDERANEAFDIIGEIFPKALAQVSPPDLLEKNIQTLTGFLDAYRNIAAYREALAQRKWRIAESELSAAKAKLRELGFDNFARGLDYNLNCLVLYHDLIAMLERLGSDSQLSPSMVLERYEELLQTARSLRGNEMDSYLGRLSDILGWFLRGAVEALRFLVNPLGEYTSNNVPRSMIAQLTSVSFVDLSRDLTSFLQFVDRQCIKLAQESESLVNKENVLALRDEAWTKIALFCNGLVFDFRGVEIALARDILGWGQNPLEDARLEMRGFKSFVERQVHKDILVAGKPQENIARALLQAFLRSRSYREVPVRGGQTDLLLFAKRGRFLYETKIWRGPTYHKQGLRELGEYIIGESDDQELLGIFYVVFDSTKSRRAQTYLGNAFSTEAVCGRSADVVVINLLPPEPSKKR